MKSAAGAAILPDMISVKLSRGLAGLFPFSIPEYIPGMTDSGSQHLTRQKDRSARVRYPQSAVFLLGGALGTTVNLLVSLAAYTLLHCPAYASVFAGTLANQLVHYVYYHVVFVNQEIRLRASAGVQLLMYVAVAAVAPLPTLFIMHATGLVFPWALLLTLALLAIANVLLVRISTYSSATLAMIEYEQMDETFYDDQTDTEKVNFIRAWFHRGRFRRLTEFVRRHYKPGLDVADIGCGNALWNVDNIPVLGVDANENMTRFALKQGRLKAYKICNDLTHIPVDSASQDLVIMSETLEHLLDYETVLREVKRLVKPGGKLLLTVPYDAFFGPFFIMFNINCLYQGYVKGSLYHRYRCGHVNHFTKRALRRTFEDCGLAVKELYVVNGLTLYCAAEPRAESAG